MQCYNLAITANYSLFAFEFFRRYGLFSALLFYAVKGDVRLL